MPAVEARGQNLVHLQQFGTISRVNILTTKAIRNYSYLDLPGRLDFFTMVSIPGMWFNRGQNSLICNVFQFISGTTMY